MKILKKKNFFFFFFFFFLRLGIFFSNWEKKSPKSHWERERILAPEDTKKIPAPPLELHMLEHADAEA